jgi:hypothetical protein
VVENNESEAFVFVSYAHSDEARVNQLIAKLVERGIRIWWDKDIEPGSPWRYTIQEHLDKAVCTLVIWTEQSVESEFVRSEASWGDVVIPVKLDASARIPVGFTETQYCDLTNWNGESGTEFDQLVAMLSRFIERGSKPIDRWVLENPQYQVSDSLSAVNELREKTAELRFFAELSTAEIKASEELRSTLSEIDKTYKTVSNAIECFLKPAANKGDIDPSPYLELERDSFRAQVEQGRGHCGLIAIHYGKYGGLRDWLAERLPPEKLADADALFASFSNADGDVFYRMVSIANLLKNQSRAIVNLLFTGQDAIARKYIWDARQELLPLEMEMGNAMRELQEIRSVLGFPGNA